MNFYYILQGWFNHFLFLLKMKTNPEWNRRLKICNACPTNIKGVCSRRKCDIIDNKRVCGCGCSITKKIKSNKTCPKGYWNNESV